MFSGRSSRSNSGSRRQRREQEQEQAQAQELAQELAQDNQVGQPPLQEASPDDQYADQDLLYSDEYAYAQGHLLGQIFLKLASDCTALARKCGLKEMETNLADLCQDFQQAMHINEDTIRATCAMVTAEENKKALEKELNSHVLNLEVAPPAYFSPVPVLTSPAKMADAFKIFPTRPKFSGTNRDGSMNLVEFLSLVKTAQKQCRLSEPEFLDVLLACTTGKAHMLLAEWIENKLNISNIFHNFTLHFDNRLTAEEARTQLSVYKAPKSANLADVMAHLFSLGARVSAAMPDEASRQATYNFEIINALIRCLPPQSATLVQTVKNTLSARLGHMCTAIDLSRALHMHRSTIDSDIKQHGIDANRGRQPQAFQRRNRKPMRPTYTSYSVTSIPPRPAAQATTPNRHFRLPPTRIPPSRRFQRPHRQQQPLQLSANFVRPAQIRGRVFGNGSGHRSNQGNHPRSSNNNGNRRPFLGCSLCGHSDHKASNGCPNIRTDSGQIYKTTSVYGTCPKCPGSKKNTLNHPPALCPFRKGGPLEHEQH